MQYSQELPAASPQKSDALAPAPSFAPVLLRTLGMLLLLGMASCSKSVTRPLPTDVLNVLYPHRGGRPDPGTTFPDYQVVPEWSAPGVITYRDNGINCVQPNGAFRFDYSLTGIWTIAPSGGTPTHMTPGGYDPSWSPDRKKLAFEYNGQIFVLEPDSGKYTQLTNTTHALNFSPAWSPTGQEIAFDSDSGSVDFGIWVMAADGSNRRLVIPNARFGSWDPSGLHMICEGAMGGTEGVLRYDIASGATTLLRAAPQIISRPRFSGDGSRIAYFDDGIWVMNSDGSNARKLSGVIGFQPALSPDGMKMVYVRAYGDTFTADAGVLWIVDLVTLQQRQLTQQWPMHCP